MKSFEGKIALVTGASGGIGAATALMLAEQGATVVAIDIAKEPDPALAQAGIAYLRMNVASEDDWTDAVSSIRLRHGAIDVLVNAAGVIGNVTQGTLERCTLEDWRYVMHVNLDGTFLACRAVMPVMKKQRQGAIVNIASLASYYPTPHNVAYGASKAAVMQLSKSVALEGAQNGAGVRCNSVHPGVIATSMIQSIGEQLAKIGDPKVVAAAEEYAKRIPLGGPGQPEDAAALIVFLASDGARYITGSEFTIDGGSHLMR